MVLLYQKSPSLGEGWGGSELIAEVRISLQNKEIPISAPISRVRETGVYLG